MIAVRMTKTVESAAKRATGVDLELVKGEGYFYFVFDDNGPRYATHSVMTMYLSHLSLEQWVAEAVSFVSQIRAT